MAPPPPSSPRAGAGATRLRQQTILQPVGSPRLGCASKPKQGGVLLPAAGQRHDRCSSPKLQAAGNRTEGVVRAASPRHSAVQAARGATAKLVHSLKSSSVSVTTLPPTMAAAWAASSPTSGQLRARFPMSVGKAARAAVSAAARHGSQTYSSDGSPQSRQDEPAAPGKKLDKSSYASKRLQASMDTSGLDNTGASVTDCPQTTSARSSGSSSPSLSSRASPAASRPTSPRASTPPRGQEDDPAIPSGLSVPSATRRFIKICDDIPIVDLSFVARKGDDGSAGQEAAATVSIPPPSPREGGGEEEEEKELLRQGASSRPPSVVLSTEKPDSLSDVYQSAVRGVHLVQSAVKALVTNLHDDNSCSLAVYAEMQVAESVADLAGLIGSFQKLSSKSLRAFDDLDIYERTIAWLQLLRLAVWTRLFTDDLRAYADSVAETVGANMAGLAAALMQEVNDSEL
eukprot:TRINITY_DN7856_c0_g1_i5.p1 TRINITY_DN7856_c0_g1~~TRINITY_DN7856_c0_g1_i5.p1  ORF type:complete len:458 (+),score=79.21 TRINITY_DN7856_c0_g1_i5:173-1546(+)